MPSSEEGNSSDAVFSNENARTWPRAPEKKPARCSDSATPRIQTENPLNSLPAEIAPSEHSPESQDCPVLMACPRPDDGQGVIHSIQKRLSYGDDEDVVIESHNVNDLKD